MFGLGTSSSSDTHVPFDVSFAVEPFSADTVTNCISDELSIGILSLSEQDWLPGTG